MENPLPVLMKKNSDVIAEKAGQMLLEKLPVDQKLVQRTVKLLEPKNLKRIAIAAVGGSVLISIVSSIGHDRVYRAAVSHEMKKQLEPLRKKLDDLEAQNVALWQQNEELKAKLDKLSNQ